MLLITFNKKLIFIFSHRQYIILKKTNIINIISQAMHNVRKLSFILSHIIKRDISPITTLSRIKTSSTLILQRKKPLSTSRLWKEPSLTIHTYTSRQEPSIDTEKRRRAHSQSRPADLCYDLVQETILCT